MRSKLGNAEAALDFLCELRDLKCGAALEQKMLSKSTDLVRQFGKEVDAASMLFHERKACLWLPVTILRTALQSCHPPNHQGHDRSCSVSTLAYKEDYTCHPWSVRDDALPRRMNIRLTGTWGQG